MHDGLAVAHPATGINGQEPVVRPGNHLRTMQTVAGQWRHIWRICLGVSEHLVLGHRRILVRFEGIGDAGDGTSRQQERRQQQASCPAIWQQPKSARTPQLVPVLSLTRRASPPDMPRGKTREGRMRSWQPVSRKSGAKLSPVRKPGKGRRGHLFSRLAPFPRRR